MLQLLACTVLIASKKDGHNVRCSCTSAEAACACKSASMLMSFGLGPWQPLLAQAADLSPPHVCMQAEADKFEASARQQSLAASQAHDAAAMTSAHTPPTSPQGPAASSRMPPPMREPTLQPVQEPLQQQPSSASAQPALYPPLTPPYASAQLPPQATPFGHPAHRQPAEGGLLAAAGSGAQPPQTEPSPTAPHQAGASLQGSVVRSLGPTGTVQRAPGQQDGLAAPRPPASIREQPAPSRAAIDMSNGALARYPTSQVRILQKP